MIEEVKGYLIGDSISKNVTTPTGTYTQTVFTLDTPDYGKIKVSLYTHYEIQLRDDEYVKVDAMYLDGRLLAHEVKVIEF
jgi:hypothetical protein